MARRAAPSSGNSNFQSLRAWVGRRSPRVKVLGIIVISALFLWAMAVAHPLISLALSAALASGWCAWLENHPATFPRSTSCGAPELQQVRDES
jgi:hypothetical protein